MSKSAFAKWYEVMTSKRMLLSLVLGFYSGLPLLLTSRTLQAWMTEAKVDLKTIGLFALVGNPYSLKFLWAPLFDRFTPMAIGRRRSWMVLSQLGLLGSLLGMAWVDPVTQIHVLALAALSTAFFSASQDIVLDAYRRELLPELEFGMGTSLFVGGYRAAMYICGAPALALSLVLPWQWVYTIAAVLMGTAILVSLWAPEPQLRAKAPRTLREAVVEPFLEFWSRQGAVILLLFVLFYKLGDAFGGNMLMSFYLRADSPYTKEEVTLFAKSYSFLSTLLGTFVGGSLILRLGVLRSLWVFGLLQAVSTMGFGLVAVAAKNLPLFATVVFFEDFTAGLGTAAFVTFMGSQTNVRFTATQYALLTSLAAVPRSWLSAPAGYFAENMGWLWFFIFAGVVALPGMALIPFLPSNEHSSRAAKRE